VTVKGQTVTKTVGVKSAKKVVNKKVKKAKAHCKRGYKPYHGRCIKAVYGKG
jgi:hypothetical protein